MNRLKYVSVILMAFVLFLAQPLKADEGMWLPMLIGKNYEQMKKQGFKLTPEDLYSVNKASIKDAIVSFGGFCTGEIVSKNGLIFTNHHCGYDAAASNSTPENNILDNGFYAKSFQEEKPIKGLFVRFLVRMEDVTPKIMAALVGVEEKDKAAKIAEVSKKITSDVTSGTTMEADVRDIYKANQYLLFIYERFNDIRLVGIPSQSIGKFGGDTDNWEWPRQTGDFSVFRVYADANNKSAAYSENNKPYTPKKSLPISIKGIKNGDFSMVYGFPGRTDRYLTSFGVNLATEKTNPTIVKLRDIRLKAWKEEMDKSVDTRLKLSSQYANIANYWKYFIGQTEQLKRLKIQDEKQKQEADFTKWAASSSVNVNLISAYKNAYAAYEPYAVHITYINEGLLASSFIRNANQIGSMIKSMIARKDDAAYLSQVNQNLNVLVNNYQNTYSEIADKKIFAQILTSFYQDVPKSQHPKFITLILEDFWKGSAEASFKNYADHLWEKSNLIDPEKMRTFLSNPSMEALENDPAYKYAVNLVPQDYVKNNFGTVLSDFQTEKNRLDNLYLKALLEKNKGILSYPDANSTMRISYGTIQNYSPKDGITYDIKTTIDGMVAKYQPGDDEFDLPKSLLEAYAKRDFREYAEGGTLPVGFISNNDITGGNSGSPVLNGNGELIGIAFDGNWEAMSGDIAFDKQYKRTISVDIRFVLWCIDVLGGARNIIDELDIRTNKLPVPKDKLIMKKQ
ncbi:Peptidase S46 [Daejeonella rubra]|uniref:Dipeptidyl-peptidase n=1 Tax=Daejeonella rubra TaxID=990371 RepID=A0A1G9S8D6_9SPHI|nr:S46 family peptidase [Daejeonella rubra]SDM31045.1 Peptidase S46 [Daejeonella rubra]